MTKGWGGGARRRRLKMGGVKEGCLADCVHLSDGWVMQTV